MAGAFSLTGASHFVLKLGELTLLDCLALIQVREEAERNLRDKMPEALGTFRALVQNAITIVDDPSTEEVARFSTQAHSEDASILTAAVLNDCQYLLTFNTRHYHPNAGVPLTILTPGKFLQRLRETLGLLAHSGPNE